jgi:hypothetical protein
MNHGQHAVVEVWPETVDELGLLAREQGRASEGRRPECREPSIATNFLLQVTRRRKTGDPTKEDGPSR